MLNYSHSVRSPQHLDLVISSGSHTATGRFGVILLCDSGIFKEYPLQFLDDDDTDFSILKKRISGVTVPDKIWPIGKLKLCWKKEI